jgi:hypothetical protein
LEMELGPQSGGEYRPQIENLVRLHAHSLFVDRYSTACRGQYPAREFLSGAGASTRAERDCMAADSSTHLPCTGGFRPSQAGLLSRGLTGSHSHVQLIRGPKAHFDYGTRPARARRMRWYASSRSGRRRASRNAVSADCLRPSSSSIRPDKYSDQLVASA